VSARRLRGDNGSAMVEFALVLPVFMLVLTGSLMFMWLLHERSNVTGAARDGARYASIQHDWMDCPLVGECATGYPTETEVSEYVNERAFGNPENPVDVDVTLERGVDANGDPLIIHVDELRENQPDRNEIIHVKASRKLTGLFGSIASLVGFNEVSYTSTAVARAE
jgi:hypothetical protein